MYQQGAAYRGRKLRIFLEMAIIDQKYHFRLFLTQDFYIFSFFAIYRQENISFNFFVIFRQEKISFVWVSEWQTEDNQRWSGREGDGGRLYLGPVTYMYTTLSYSIELFILHLWKAWAPLWGLIYLNIGLLVQILWSCVWQPLFVFFCASGKDFKYFFFFLPL